MEKKLKKISKRVNIYLNSYLSKFNSSELVPPMKYGLFPGGKKIRSKIIFDVGSMFNLKKKKSNNISSISRSHPCLLTDS